MQCLTLPRLPVDRRELALREPGEPAMAAQHHVRPQTVVLDAATHQPVIVLDQVGDGPGSLIGMLDRVRFPTTARTSGLPSTSRVFGYEPRRTIRQDYCKATILTSEEPEVHAVLAAWAGVLADHYARLLPDQAREHRLVASGVRREYLLPGRMFTSGIVNRSNRLRYHQDRGNKPGLWSAMLVLRHAMSGGHLHVPEYDALLELPHGALLLFNGADLWHGVTPMVEERADAVRYSLVFYTLAGMWRCLPPAEELERIRQVKTGREQRRART